MTTASHSTAADPAFAAAPHGQKHSSGEDLAIRSLDAALVTTARTQRGMFTTAQATAAGLSAPVLVKLVKAGVLRHPGRGLYAVAALCEPDPEAWHRQLCAGAFLLYPDAVLAGTSALLAHGIPIVSVRTQMSASAPRIRARRRAFLPSPRAYSTFQVPMRT